MRIYLAGTTVAPARRDSSIAKLFRRGYKMHSYHHIRDEGFEAGWFEVNSANKVDLFLDSGAFSVMKQGVEIDIKEYIRFIKEHEDVIEVYANLDVIVPKDKELGAKLSYKNLKKMEKAGLSPLPVFHAGEPEWYLQHYIDNYDYIGVGGMVDVGTDRLKFSTRSWLDRAFRDYLCDEEGWPKLKVHGFGLTTLRDMLRYPWWSVDSTSWVVASRIGSIYMPRFRGNEWTYDKEAWLVSVSNKSPSKHEGGKHFTTLPPGQQRLVLDYLENQGYRMGESKFRMVSQSYKPKEDKDERWAEKKPEDPSAKRKLEVIVEPGVSNRYQDRDELNIIYFKNLQDHLPEWPTRFAPDGGVQGFGL